MAASPSASPPSSASLTAPEWLYDSSTVKPSANQPQNTSTGAASLYKGLNHVRECLWVLPLGGSYWQLIPIRKLWIRMVADFFVLPLSRKKNTFNIPLPQILVAIILLYSSRYLYSTIFYITQLCLLIVFRLCRHVLNHRCFGAKSDMSYLN